MKNKKKKSKVLKIVMGSSVGMVVMSLIIIIPVLMVLDFFGANITDNYVENNMDYADMYKETLNSAIKSGYGYVPLNRILYFYLEDEKLTFLEIYKDNIDSEDNRLKEISEVCTLPKYKIYDGCKEIDEDQVDEIQNKPFSPPVDFSKVTITSFFMEERIVFGTPGVHSAWDLAAGNKTPVKSVCDGTVKKVSFKYSENVTDKNGGGGNQIYLECPIDEELTYTVIYAHLYPGTSKVKEGDSVKAGDELAGIGTTGYSTGPHLHYQVQVDGENVDGMSLIDFSDKKPPFNPGYNPGFNPGGLTPYNPNPNFPTRP